MSAVAMSVTVTGPTAPGYLVAYPCTDTPPTAANVNYVAGQTTSNMVTVKLDDDGSVCFFAYGATHVVADVVGYYTEGGDLVNLPVLVD